MYPTILHSIASKLRAITPAVNRLRGPVTALVTPFLWSQTLGHWRSCLKGKAVDAQGNPLVWYTYPAIQCLQNVDFSDKTVLELGAGNSTLWWAQRAKHVTAVEDDKEWYDYLQNQLPDNVSLYLVATSIPPNQESIEVCKQHAPYDVIVIDGFDRAGFAELVSGWLKPDGVIIFDNSERNWSHDDTQSFMNNFQDFQRVDFYGYCPNASLPQCTSIFFTPDSFMFSNQANPSL